MGNVYALLGPGVQVCPLAIGLRCRRYGKQNYIIKYYYIIINYKYLKRACEYHQIFP